jgi:putative Holliday junction resolvase
MGKILAIDFGTKRCGIAITDDLKIIASPLGVQDSAGIFTYLSQLLKKEAIDCIVIGEPRRLNYEMSITTEIVHKFGNRLQQLYPSIPIKYIDERLTSKIAQNTLVESGLGKKKRQEKGRLDVISATLILQTYLESPH